MGAGAGASASHGGVRMMELTVAGHPLPRVVVVWLVVCMLRRRWRHLQLRLQSPHDWAGD